MKGYIYSFEYKGASLYIGSTENYKVRYQAHCQHWWNLRNQLEDKEKNKYFYHYLVNHRIHIKDVDFVILEDRHFRNRLAMEALENNYINAFHPKTNTKRPWENVDTMVSEQQHFFRVDRNYFTE
jgi:hypothetical protein